MDQNIQALLEALSSTDDKLRMDVLQSLLQITESKVDWVYEAWDLLLEKLDHENSYQRSIGIMLLCNLAKSDTENRLATSLDHLLAHTRDEKFITSRQCLQHIWKVAAANSSNREKIVMHLEQRFVECADEKHYNLLRQDILQSMLALYRIDPAEALFKRAQALLPQEQDAKYRKKYEALFKIK